MGCGTCPKKKPKLNSAPQGITPELLQQLQSHVQQRVKIKDRLGQTTLGTCLEVWVDDEQEGTLLEYGNVAVRTLTGVSLVGFNIIESIETV